MNLLPSPEELAELTPENPFERSPDGRPRVPDGLLDRLKTASTEEIWTVLRQHGYERQYAGEWQVSHPDRVLVGRAVTALFTPMRPDYHAFVDSKGHERGWRTGEGGHNNWVMDLLQAGDCPVMDCWGKVEKGPLIGDNLGTTIARRCGTGAVINGTVRDYHGLLALPNFVVFSRGVHPSYVMDVTLTGINIPIRIGDATVLPGDVVHGSVSGVIFIPPHLVQEVVEFSERVKLRDLFVRQRLEEGRYRTGDLDRRTWAPEIEADFERWRLDAVPAR